MDLNVLGELHNMCFLTRVHNHVAIFQTIRTMEKLFNQMHYLLLAFLWCSIWRGKGSTLGKCQLCCCMIWSLQGRLIIALFIILAIFPLNVQGLKQKHFVASAQGQRIMYINRWANQWHHIQNIKGIFGNILLTKWERRHLIYKMRDKIVTLISCWLEKNWIF